MSFCNGPQSYLIPPSLSILCKPSNWKIIKVQHNLFLWTEMWQSQTKEKWQFLVRFSEVILKFGLQTRNVKLQHNLFVCTELWENQTCLKEIVCVYSKSRHRETIQSNFIWGTVKLCLYMLTLTIPFSILLLYISSVPSENLSILLYFIKTGDTEDIAR